MEGKTDILIQANLELHEELGKEVRINLENEAKIRRLERQQARYEEDIQYLYSVIEKLESQKEHDEKEIQSLRNQLAESHRRLKNSEKLCDEKEKFILFRESQLLESEDTIFRLKQQISKLSSNKMARVRTDLTPLDSLPNNRLLGEIQANIDQLYIYAIGGERTPNVNTAQRLRDRTGEASTLLHGRLRACEEREEGYAENKDKLLNDLEQYRQENMTLKESLEGTQAEILDYGNRLQDAMNEIFERGRLIESLDDKIKEILREAERLGANYDALTGTLERNLNYTRIQRDRIAGERDQLAIERDDIFAHYRAEQLLTRRLTRQRLALRIANRQLQIRLMAVPAVIPPPIPQPINQIWLLYQ